MIIDDGDYTCVSQGVKVIYRTKELEEQQANRLAGSELYNTL